MAAVRRNRSRGANPFGVGNQPTARGRKCVETSRDWRGYGAVGARHRYALTGFLLAAAALAGAENTAPTAVPFADVSAFAAARQIPLRGVDIPGAVTQIQSGDTLTVLVTMAEGDRRQQWLAIFQVVPLTDRERAGSASVSEAVFTSTGNEFHFNSRPAALALRMFGPFTEADPPRAPGAIPEKTARLVVHEEFLRFGFARFSESALARYEAHKKFPYHVAGVRFDAALIAREKPLALAAGLTRDDEEVIAEINPALNQFLAIAQNTPGLEELAFKVMDLPPVWALLGGGGTGFDLDPKNITRFDTAEWDMSSSPAYRYPFAYTLKGTRSLQGIFFFASPAPPLQACAGIIGLIAQSPKHPEKRLELRVLAARLAGGSSK